MHDPNVIGSIMSRSFFVIPGTTYKKIWYIVIGLLSKIPQNAAIFTDAKKYSPGANWRNLIPTAGIWNIWTICLISAKHINVDRTKRIKQKILDLKIQI